MSEELYNERIVALARAKDGATRLPAPTVTVDCDNPLCGDRILLDLALEGGRVTGIGHKTRGCLLTQASASLLSRLAPGRDRADLGELEAAVRAIMSGSEPPVGAPAEIEVFVPLQKVKSRQDCVLLPFRAMAQALALAEEKHG